MGYPQQAYNQDINEPYPFKGQHVVVVGAGNSSVDICQDLAECGAASVTMIQRTAVVVTDRNKENLGYSAFMPPDVPVEVSDFKVASVSKGYICRMSLAPDALKWYWEVMNKEVAEKVEKGGFMLDKTKTQTVLWFERLGGESFDGQCRWCLAYLSFA